MSTYEWSTDGTTWTHLYASGFKNLTRTRRSASLDTVTLQRSLKTALTDSDLWSYGTAVQIRKDSTLWFQGTVDTLPRMGDAVDEMQMITLAGPWRQLEKCTYQQSWKVYDVDGSALTNVNKSRVVLMQDSDGDRTTTGAQITDAIDWAIAKGANITKGTIDAGTELPFDERDNMSCADVLLTMLRWLPDYVTWFDYSTSTPTFHCRKRSNLTAASKALTSGNLIEITPRNDRQVSGISITYERTHNDDGDIYKTVDTDDAGTTTALDTVFANFDLAGSTRTYVKQKVVTGTFPTLSSDKSFLKTMIPALAEIDDADITINSATNSSAQPRYLTEGQVPDWMSKTAEEATIEYNLDAVIKDGSDTIEELKGKIFKVQVQATNATTKTYKRLTAYDSGESVPTGVAAALYASWNTLHYEGTFRFTAEEPAGTVGPGNRFNITSGVTAWASMDALVQEVIEQVDTGTTTVRFGPPRQLEADTLVALFRALRSRRYSWSRSSRTTGTAGEDSDVDLGGASPTKSSTETAGEKRKLRVRNTDGTNDHDIELDPTAVAFADAGNQAAQQIKPREMVLPFIDAADSDKLKAKLAQVMASAPYGDEQEIPLGLPSDPSSPATVGDTDEGDETADSTTYTANATGLQLHCMTRVGYFDSGDEKLYGYIRTLKFDKFGRLSSLSAETRIIIDTPEL